MKTRWNRAQVAEKRFWDKFLNMNYTARPEWRHYFNLIKKYVPIKKDTAILDVGCGAYGILNGLKTGKRYGIEPLMDFFLSKIKMSKKIKWIAGKGEKLPFKNKFFDVIFCINVLDHVEAPEKTLKEINRCLKDKKIFFLTLNCYGLPVALFRRFLEKINFGDPGHPHSYTIKEMEHLLSSNNFEVVEVLDERELPVGNNNDFIKKPSFFQKIKRIYKETGLIHSIKRIVAFPIYWILTKISRDSPNHIFMCRKK